MLADEVVARLRAAYEPAADPERAEGETAYLRNQFPFLGMRTADRRRLSAHALADLPPPDENDLASVARALWSEPEREFQHAGCDYVRAHISVASAGFTDILHDLVTTKSWWDTVDPLAAHAAGPLVRRHSGLAAVMDRWVVDDDLWVARTAILHQLTYKRETNEQRLFRYCRLQAPHRDFFIRKAIGWALRSYAAVAPQSVAAFVGATPSLSALSVREATRRVVRATATTSATASGPGGHGRPPAS
ncbi:MAG: DNA alkylation repair protein [Acidimicrobiales bacterium]